MNIPTAVLNRINAGEPVTIVVPPADGYQPGAILDWQWGYDQTNCNFFRIVKRSGGWVTVEEIAGTETSDGPQSMTGRKTVAQPVRAVGKPFRRKLAMRDGKPFGIAIEKYGWCDLWDGKPVAVSHYG